jgi:hypothetical protein
MLPCLSVKHSDKTVNARRCEIAIEVLKQFEGKLPDRRLLVFLDDRNWDELRGRGSENRGAFFPICEYHYQTRVWPDAIQAELAHVDLDTLKFSLLVDGLVYLHEDTCANESALTTTLAHELQHFVQYNFHQEMWAWSVVLVNCNGLIDAEGLSWEHIPVEREARIVAKRISQAILGNEKSDEYIAFRQTRATKPRDIGDWRFIKTIDTTLPYDVASETRAIFNKYGRIPAYRQEMERVLATLRKMPEVRNLMLNDIIEN